jgi:hypothetical protein
MTNPASPPVPTTKFPLSGVEQQRRYRGRQEIVSVDICSSTAAMLKALRGRTGQTTDQVITAGLRALTLALDAEAAAALAATASRGIAAPRRAAARSKAACPRTIDDGAGGLPSPNSSPGDIAQSASPKPKRRAPPSRSAPASPATGDQVPADNQPGQLQMNFG